MRDSDQEKWHWGSRALVGIAVFAMMGVAVPAHAQDDDEDGDAEGPDVVCDVVDDRISSISGMVATSDGYWVLPEASFHVNSMDIFPLSSDCEVLEPLIIDHQPREPEDLAYGSDGFLWAADIGDELVDRPNIAVTRVNPEDSFDREIYRFEYPDGAKDVKTMLLTPDNEVAFIYNDGDSVSFYTPSTLNYQEEGTPLEEAGSVELAEFYEDASDTEVTGAAVSPDGNQVVLRTASEAYEWDVSGSVIGSILDDEPRVTILDDEPSGTITYDDEGHFLVPGGGEVRSYQPGDELAEDETDDGADEEVAAEEESSRGFVDYLLDTFGPSGIVRALMIGAFVGLVLMLTGIWTIVRYRRKSRERAMSIDDDDDSDLDDEFGDLDDFGDSRDARRGYTSDIKVEENYGDPDVSRLANPPAASRPEDGNVYGARPQSGSVYGGGDQGGSVYGAAASGPAGEARSARDQEPPGWFAGTSGRNKTGGVYGAGSNEGTTYGAAQEPGRSRSGNTYGAGARSGGNTYGSSAGQGKTYGSASGGATYGSGDRGGSVYGGQDHSGSVYGSSSGSDGGSVYGSRREEDDPEWGRDEGYGR